jgi:hypothetical protein
VTVGSLWGDFYIDQSVLEFKTCSVPIPSPLILLLSGSAALIGIRRRMFIV